MEKNRLFRRSENEGNFNIFHQMFAGMTKSELDEFHLSGYSARNLNWMPKMPFSDLGDKTSFDSWKKSLVQLGIPLLDILRVLAAVLLVGNMEYGWRGDHTVGRVATLLGVNHDCLVGGLWRRTHHVRGTLVTRDLDQGEWEVARRGLAGSLYIRTVYMVIRRVNSHHAAPSSDCEKNFPPASFVGILDMSGWQSSLQAACNLEQLCMNHCSEQVQQLYNTSIINSYCSDTSAGTYLGASTDCGLFPLLDRETHSRGGTQAFLSSIKSITRTSQKLLKPDKNYSSCFSIQHHMGPVLYNASQFIGN